MRLSDEEKITANSKLHKKLYRHVILTQKGVSCSICPPNGGENARRKSKYPIKKPYQLDSRRRHR